ncbi:MAG: hypothetical protein R3B90_16125 [Planctomycetaceae bacterium]
MRHVVVHAVTKSIEDARSSPRTKLAGARLIMQLDRVNVDDVRRGATPPALTAAEREQLAAELRNLLEIADDKSWVRQLIARMGFEVSR